MKKMCFLIVSLFFYLSCTETSFEMKLLTSLKTGNYIFLIENSSDTIRERSTKAALAELDEFRDDIKLERKIYMHDNKYEVVFINSSGRYIIFQFEKIENKFIVYSIELSVKRP